MRNRVGCCVLTDEELFHVKTRFIDEERKGDPRQLGAPHDGAWRVTLALVNGTICTVTVCEEALPEVEGRLREIWRNCLEAFAFDRQFRNLTPAQAEQQDKELAELEYSYPIGVLDKTRWRDHV